MKKKSLLLTKNVKEYGHYKPILDDVKKYIKINYNIDNVFIWSRRNYLYKILNYENNGKFSIKTFNTS